MADSGQKFIKRNRPPRVHITYEDPYDAERNVELPFVMGVMADLSGNSPGVEKERLAERKFVEFDMDNFNKRMGRIKPGVSFCVPNKLSDNEDDNLSVNLTFETMEDFSPAAIARNVEPLKTLMKERERLSNLLRYMDGKVAANSEIQALLKDRDKMAVVREMLEQTRLEKEAKEASGETQKDESEEEGE